MKKILMYIIITISTIMVLFIALVISSKIPHGAIKDNVKESVEFYKTKAGIYRIKNKKIYSYIHYFADIRKINIIYCLDSNKAIESSMWAKYYQNIKKDTNKDLIDLVENSREPNTQYLRYWNGIMIILRPLLIVFNMKQIYLINIILLTSLILILCIILLKLSKKIAGIFLFALIMVSSWYVPLCIEYSVTFYIMIITSILALKIDNKKNISLNRRNDNLQKLFLITGIVTTFFEFLTTELLTIFVPLIFILALRKERGQNDNLKTTLKFIMKSIVLWFIGYCGMWLAKWLFASLILNINAFEYVKDNFFLRINGLQGLSNHKELYKKVIGKNVFAIPLIDYIHTHFYKIELKIAIFSIIFSSILFIDWKKLKTKKYLLIIIIIGCIPYIRYLILANHSYRHAMFTFRDQIITIMALLYVMIESLNYKLILKKIKISEILKIKK